MQNVQRQGPVHFVLTVDDDGEDATVTRNVFNLLLKCAVLGNDGDIGHQSKLFETHFYTQAILSAE